MKVLEKPDTRTALVLKHLRAREFCQPHQGFLPSLQSISASGRRGKCRPGADARYCRQRAWSGRHDVHFRQNGYEVPSVSRGFWRTSGAGWR